MGRSPCCSKEGMNRGAWTAMEDKILTSYINVHGEGKWRNLPKRAGLKRCGKSCRLRWLNYLRPDIKRGNITPDEEELIVRLHKLLGNRWSLIAGRLPGRTDNEIKNYWNTTLSKKTKPPTPESSSDHSANDKIEVIRTKATRCTRAVVPTDHQSLSEYYGIEEQQQEMFNTTNQAGDDYYCDLSEMWLSQDHHWTTLGEGEDDDGINDTLDIDSLAFLLDSQ